MNEVPTQVLDKLKKLKALADNPGTPEEASNAMAKMQDLLLKHNLSMTDVLAHQHKSNSNNVTSFIFDLNEHQGRHDAQFYLKLISAICYFNFCRPVREHRYRHEYDQGDCTIVGAPHNVEAVKYLLDYCVNNCIAIEKQYWKKYQGPEKRNTFRRGFYQGFVIIIADRLGKQQAETIEESAKERNVPVSEMTNALMVIKENQLQIVSKEVERLFGETREVKNRSVSSQDGKVRGMRAGAELNLSKGLDNTPDIRGHLN